MQKAVINKSTGEVENIIEYADRGVAMRLPLGYMVQDCSYVDVQTGDTFKDGAFYRDGVPVENVPTEAQRLSQIEEELTILAGTGAHENRKEAMRQLRKKMDRMISDEVGHKTEGRDG